ncbi:hypothetical protein CL634_08075 [bacterium]|nr:hypothetical protein [bacterium]
MKISYTGNNGRVTVQLEGDTQAEVFAQLASFQEVFDETECGKCQSENLRFQVRNIDDNLYYELKCMDCGARLSFGALKKGGGLFPRRKDKEGNWLSDRGWVKWNPETKQEE